MSKQYGVNAKTVLKWKGRDSVEDQKCGAKPGQNSVLSKLDEALIVETRTKTLLPLDDLFDLLPTEEKAKHKGFKAYKPGYLHIDTAQINLGQDKWYLFVAIDRATRYVYLELHGDKTMATADAFLKAALAQYSFKVEKTLADNRAEYSHNLLPEDKKPKDDTPHAFDKTCQDNKIEHRTTLVKHPWTNGMVEAMNKKLKANTVKKYHYGDVDALKKHLYEYGLNYLYPLGTIST